MNAHGFYLSCSLLCISHGSWPHLALGAVRIPFRTMFVDLAQSDALKPLSEKLHLEEINLSLCAGCRTDLERIWSIVTAGASWCKWPRGMAHKHLGDDASPQIGPHVQGHHVLSIEFREAISKQSKAFSFC